MKRLLMRLFLGILLLLALASCGAILLTQRDPHDLPPPKVVLGFCPNHPPTVSVTTPIPTTPAHTIYTSGGWNLYALDARTGAMRWCRQAMVTNDYDRSKGGQPPAMFIGQPALAGAPPATIFFGQPTVTDGVVYVCASGFGEGQTYAFRADDGALLWQATSGCWVVSMPFADNAVPLVDHGVIYSGPDALWARDGQVIWTTPAGERYFSPQALVDGVLYANDEQSVYALDATNGSVRWKYTAPDGSPPGGRLAVADGHVFYGTLDSVDGSETSALYALNARNGALLWKSTMATYSNPTATGGLVYIGSADHTLYALQASDGAARWRYTAPSSVYTATTVAGGVAYAILDGSYALDAVTGKLLWHRPLDANQSISFTPIALAGNVVYLGRTDGVGNCVLYALNAATGATYWQLSGIRPIMPLVVE